MSIRFCEDCGNMLTPVERNNRLIYMCNMCNTRGIEKENSKDNNIVYRNEIKLINY